VLGGRREVLEGVHGKVDGPGTQRLAEGGDEDARPTQARERCRAVTVTLGRDLDELDVVPEGAQLVGDPRRLRGRECGAAGAEAEGHRPSSSSSVTGTAGGVATTETSRGSRSNSSLSALA